ncbi:hypothetical protein BC941DRAFT_437556 [Chlamydoabsidia padenii]|nr:hypothetical protein BC941DRAFT_437556 [Chlamydoabsidia padenii]
MGLHLLLSPKATVNVLSPRIRLESSHLYPKLAGSNWDCYITRDVVRLGRAPEHQSQDFDKLALDVDFCGNKQISRRHADIRFNPKSNHWELRVYGRIGVKVNHTLITKKRRPVPLTNMAYLDIGGNGFVFMLPDNTDGKPGGKSDPQTTPTLPATAATTATTSTTETPTTATSTSIALTDTNSLENEKDDALITLITTIFEKADEKDYQPTTQQILKSVIQHSRKESLDQDQYTMETVLRSLVLDSRFKVAKTSLDMTAEQADKVKWYWDRPPPPPPPPTSSSFGTTTASAEDWSDFGYDFMDTNDHAASETNEESSTPTGTPTTVMESGSWPSSLNQLSDTTSPRIPLNYTHQPLSVISPSPDQSTCSPIQTAWDKLEMYKVSGYPEDIAISGYSRGVSLVDMYSTILAIEGHGSHVESSSLSSPITLKSPREPDHISSNRKRKRPIAGHEDRNLWTRFRTTLFRAQP